MSVLKIDALTDNLDKVIGFIDTELEQHNTSMKVQTQIDVAVEEIFVNICHYAYGDEVGKAEISFDYDTQKESAVITFVDSGAPYDPLQKDDPDITLSAEERQIGGLGIYIVKKSMDEVNYLYEDGKNKLSLIKKL